MQPIFQRLFLAAAALAPLTAAGQQNDRMEPAHVARLKYVNSVAVSPDGKAIAYTVSVSRSPVKSDDGSAWSELFVTDLAGNRRPFITGEVSIGAPAWSPDGRWIYYLAKRDGDEEKVLYRIAVDGGESIRTIKHATSISGFDLSPDGTSVAFLATEEIEKGQKELRKQGFNQQIYEEDWQPTRIWIASVDPAATEGESQSEARMLELEGSASDVQWSPNGKDLMVVLAPTPSVDDSYMKKKVHVVESDSGRVIRSLNNPGKLGQVEWSPDGKHLAIVSAVDINDPQEGHVMIAPVAEEQPLVDLMPGYEAHVESIAWQDDSSLLWLAGDGVGSRIGTVDRDGNREDLIEPGEQTVFRGFSLSDDGQIAAFVGHSAKHPTEVFVREGNDPRRLTNVNPWLDDLQFAKQEKITWKARDGLELQGVLVYPLNYVEGRRYPTIMYVHGGPESHESNGWITSYSRPGQVGAARGFVVFYPNYRGSTGRGVEFSKMGQADHAGKEFDDLVDGIDHLIKIGIADSKAIGVTGGSYGGYASAWCSTYYSDRFAASVMFVGISDNLSKAGTTDIPEEMFLVHARKRLWDDWDYFLKSSPIRYVERNKTPTLILHGKNDPRVHPSQSLELHRHLKTLQQAPVRLVLYEGEGHGNRKAAARLDYNLRMLRWMQQFLQQGAEQAPPFAIDYHEALGIPKEE